MEFKEKFYVERVKCVSKKQAYEVQIWIKLNDNSKKIYIFSDVAIINTEGDIVERLTIQGGSHQLIRCIGGSEKTKSYCFPFELKRDIKNF